MVVHLFKGKFYKCFLVWQFINTVQRSPGSICPCYERPPGVHDHFSMHGPLSHGIWPVTNNHVADMTSGPQIMTKTHILPAPMCSLMFMITCSRHKVSLCDVETCRWWLGAGLWERGKQVACSSGRSSQVLLLYTWLRMFLHIVLISLLSDS